MLCREMGGGKGYLNTQTFPIPRHPTSLLVEDGKAGLRVLRVPDADGAVGGAGGQPVVEGGVGQTPHAVLVARQHAALDARIWTEETGGVRPHGWRDGGTAAGEEDGGGP